MPTSGCHGSLGSSGLLYPPKRLCRCPGSHVQQQVLDQPWKQVLSLPLRRDAEVFQASNSVLGLCRGSL